MSFSWSTQKIASLLHVPASREIPIAQITTDSRAVQPGSLFVAIKGDQFDGHDFIEQSIAKGAAAILTEKPVANPGDAIVFQVQSTLQAIRKLSAAYRAQFPIPVIGVVGAVGKTTTKELLSSILQGKFPQVLKTEGSLNGYLGIPLTLLRLRPEHQVAVIEIGIDEIGAMEQHLAVVQPTHVILTANGPEHLHQLKTVEIAASEELKALDYAFDRELPMALNLSDEFVLRWYAKHAKQFRGEHAVTYSLRQNIPSQLQPTFTGEERAEANELRITAQGLDLRLPTPLPGTHHAHNLLAAVAMASFFGMTTGEIEAGLRTFKTAFGRTEIYPLDGGTEIIGDYYNSNPTSVRAALQLLQSRASGGRNTHAVLGDMLELGSDEERFHRELATMLESTQIRNVWLYGPRMKWLREELEKRGFAAVRHFETHPALVEALQPAIRPGDRILIKGSRGMRMEKVLEPLIGKTLQK